MFHSGIFTKLQGFYKWYVLGLVSVGYILGELGHYLIGEFHYQHCHQPIAVHFRPLQSLKV